jgi:hypothetical protein
VEVADELPETELPETAPPETELPETELLTDDPEPSTPPKPSVSQSYELS